jgi:hypothetical protein
LFNVKNSFLGAKNSLFAVKLSFLKAKN